ncbi:MAG: alpha/beta hydrolase family protein [Armatimonadota bacterium]
MKDLVLAVTAVVVTIVAAGAAAGASKSEEVSSMIRALYADFDPRKDPLEIETIREWDEDGIHIEQLYFTGQIIDGVKTRVYAYRGAPIRSRRLPGVLYCHGGGQTAYLEWVRFWARRGYVCVSFDYSGGTNKLGLPQYRREHFTRWGPAVEQLMASFAASAAAERSPKGDSWYHYCLAARRALTLLENHPRVDPNRLGAYGVSAGGWLCWLLAGTDSRVKTIVPIYGAASAFRDKRGFPIRNVTPEIQKAAFRDNPGSPAFYAPLVTCPVLYMTATNDGAFSLDSAFDTIDRLGSSTVRLLYTPRWNHHMEPPESRVLPLWMDRLLKARTHNWPKTPGIEFDRAGEVPRIIVTPDESKPIEKVDVYYALNEAVSMRRFWRAAQNTRRCEQCWIADAPFVSEGDRIYAFANVLYRSGEKVSSRLAELSTRLSPSLRPTLGREALIDSMETSANWYWVPAYPDPKIYDSYFRVWTGPAGERGFTVAPFDCDNPPFVMADGTLKFNFGTHKIGVKNDN